MASCRSCGARDVVPAIDVGGTAFSICQSCSSLQHEIGFRPSELEQMDVYRGVSGYGEFCMKFGQSIFRTMPLIRYIQPGRAFCIEANDGHLGSTWIHRGWSVDASSLSVISANRARRVGLRVNVGDPSAAIASFGVKAYDAAFTDNGYTRFANPIAELRSVASVIRPGAALLIRGPDPCSKDVLSGSTSTLGRLNQTIPSQAAIMRMAGESGLVLVDRRDDGPDMTLVLVRIC